MLKKYKCNFNIFNLYLYRLFLSENNYKYKYKYSSNSNCYNTVDRINKCYEKVAYIISELYVT